MSFTQKVDDIQNDFKLNHSLMTQEEPHLSKIIKLPRQSSLTGRLTEQWKLDTSVMTQEFANNSSMNEIKK